LADIAPFRAYRYDGQRVPPETVLTQPYDKISPKMQDGYYAASPYNLVRIILGKTEPSDTDSSNVYTRAAANFGQWRQEGVLQQDPEPSIYAYSQTFIAPGRTDEHVRRGFVAAGRIEDYAKQVVFRHEYTLAKPKADRLNLLRATRAHFGQIFVVYSDPSQQVETAIPWDSQPTTELRYGEWPIVTSLSGCVTLWPTRSSSSQMATIATRRRSTIATNAGHLIPAPGQMLPSNA
jgi:uncharacterized protein (DUF1015 family)